MNAEKERILIEAGKERTRRMKEPELRTLFFELTDACNLHCLHCGSSCGPERARYLPIELIEKTLRSVKEAMGTDRTLIALTGGEPLLHPSFFEIARLIDGMGFRWGITTNGTLIDRKTALKLKENHIASIAFSLDGNQETHNLLRRNPRAFEKAVEGIRAFVEVAGHDAATMITSVIHKGNIGQLAEMYDIAKSLRVHFWRPINVEPIGRANDHNELFLSKEDYRTLFDFICHKRKEGGPMQVTYGCSHFLPLEYELEVRGQPFYCMAGIHVASILVDGSIYACLDIERRPELIEGNVKEDDFFEVWQKKFAFYRKDRTNCSYCASCPRRAYCLGDSAHTWNFEANQPNLCLYRYLESESGGNGHG